MRLRVAYFERMDIPVQYRTDEVSWMAATDGGRVTGCYSFSVHPERCWVQDFYTVGGVAGNRAWSAMYARIKARADSLGEEVICVTDPRNASMAAALLRRGFCFIETRIEEGKLIGLAFQRLPCMEGVSRPA